MRRSSPSVATTYSTSGCTATAVLETRVHGVVVHTSREVGCSGAAAGPEVTGNRTYTEGSVTVSYPWASSWSESVVPQRGQ